MNTPADKKIVDLVKRLHAEGKTGNRAKPLLEEAATNLRLQAAEIERLKGLVE